MVKLSDEKTAVNGIQGPGQVTQNTTMYQQQNTAGRHVTVDVTETDKPMSTLVWRLMLLAGVLIYGSYSVFVHLCEVNGKLPFSSFSVILLIEVSKLSITLVLIPSHLRRRYFASLRSPSRNVLLRWPRLFLSPYIVPALLYTLTNNMGMHMQLEMDPVSFQVLGNLKILSTALLYRLIIQRPITEIQWFSLFLLACAGATNSFGGFHAKGVSVSASEIHISLRGIVMVTVYCLVSGLAGVYSEYILKKKYETSIHIQNAMLYIYGVLLNGGVWAYGASNSDEPEAWNLLQGFSGYTWIVVLSQALVGLIMSAIMKHGNNITRLFLIACAMLVTTTMSMLVFGLQLNGYFCLAFLLVVTALILYHNVVSVDMLPTRFKGALGRILSL